jgi:hypothetical protein
MTTACQKEENYFQELVLVGRHRYHALGRRIFAIDVFGEINRLALGVVPLWELLGHFRES